MPRCVVCEKKVEVESRDAHRAACRHPDRMPPKLEGAYHRRRVMLMWKPTSR